MKATSNNTTNAMKKVYISIPISGENYNDQRNHAFVVATNIAQKGYEVVTPFDIVKSPHTPYSEAMGMCMKELLECDAICLCKGWRKSKGCTAELQIALVYGLEVMAE